MAKLPASSNFFFGIASGPLQAGGFFFCLWLAEGNQRWSVQLAECLFFGLASDSLRVGGFSFAFGSQKANSVGLYSSPGAFFFGLVSGSLRARGFFFYLSLAKGNRRLSLQRILYLLKPWIGLFPYPNGKPALPYFPFQVCPVPIFQNPDTTKNAPYDQRPNGALWWALRNSNP